MATKSNRSERRSWDKYVSEAREVFTEIELSENDVIKVYVPSSDAMEKIGENDNDLWAQIDILMGEDNGKRVRAVAGDAPVTALRALIGDVFSDLGLSSNPGE